MFNWNLQAVGTTVGLALDVTKILLMLSFLYCASLYFNVLFGRKFNFITSAICGIC